jgi:cellulase
MIALVALFAHSALAHTYLSSIYLGGQALAEGDCVRPHPLTAYDSPIPLVTAPDMTCGWLPQSATPANRKCPIAAGSTIGLQWHHQTAAATDDIIDPSHEGPIIVYLAKSDTGAGNVWFKIYEDGFDGKWAVDRLLANKGRVDITLPSDIAPGNYLLRGEVIALHGAYALNGVQPYVGCVELTISGSGSANPSGVAFPGYYTNSDPGMLFNLYGTFTTYPIPGPAIYKSGSSGSSSSGSSSSGSNTAAPTSAPTSAPPTQPTTKPTSAPTAAPTSNPGTGGSNIKVNLNSGTSVWWVGVAVSGGGETTVKVEMTDSGSLTSWTTLTDKSYAYVYENGVQVRAPLSIRLTSSSGKQVVLTNVFTSLTSFAVIDTGKTYSSGSGTATSAPTSAPTTKPTSAPTNPPSNPTTTPKPSSTNPPSSGGSNAKVTLYSGSSAWWLGVTISGNSETVQTVELKDSGAVTSYKAMTNNNWAYTYPAGSTALVAPVTVRITTSSGKTSTATITSITPGAVYNAYG